MDRICSSSLRGVMVLMVDGPIVAGMEAPERTTGWCSFIMCLYFGLDSSVGSFVVVMELQNKLSNFFRNEERSDECRRNLSLFCHGMSCLFSESGLVVRPSATVFEVGCVPSPPHPFKMVHKFQS